MTMAESSDWKKIKHFMFIAPINCVYNARAIMNIHQSSRDYFIREAARTLTFIEHTLTAGSLLRVHISYLFLQRVAYNSLYLNSETKAEKS